MQHTCSRHAAWDPHRFLPCALMLIWVEPASWSVRCPLLQEGDSYSGGCGQSKELLWQATRQHLRTCYGSLHPRTRLRVG